MASRHAFAIVQSAGLCTGRSDPVALSIPTFRHAEAPYTRRTAGLFARQLAMASRSVG